MKFALTKTVSYDLSAEVDIPEATSAEEALAIIEREGEGWIEWEQSDGNDEVIEAFGIEE
jgi:hypothetical protein